MGPGYLSRSPKNNSSRCINYFPELNSKDSSAEYSLVGTPGCHLWTTAGGIVRGSHVFNSLTYVVVGSGLYSITSNGTISSSLGTLTTSSGRVEMSDNGLSPTGGNQLIIVDGSNSYYVYVVSSSAFSILSDVVPATEANVLPTPIGGGTWSPIIWNGTTYITVANGLAALSTTGDTWTINAMPSGHAWSSVAWNGSVFCAINSQGTTDGVTSPDGVTWTPQTLPSPGASSSWTSITAMGTKFCIVAGGAAATNLTAISYDSGVTWGTHSLPATAFWCFVTNNGTSFLALTQTNSSVCATSTDGVTWAQHAMPLASSWLCAAWNGTVYCATTNSISSGYCATSPDGATWTQYTMPKAYNYSSIAWTGSVFLAISNSGNIDGMAYSPTGATWTAINLPSIANWYIVASNGIGGAILINLANQVADISSQALFSGTNLLKITLSTSYSVYSVCYIHEYFVITLGGSQYLPLSLNDGTRYDFTDASSASVSSDTLLTVRNNQDSLWLFCSSHTEIWGITGNLSPLFALVSGGVFDYGISSCYSVIEANNTVYALATHKNNDVGEFYAVVAASGYSIVPVSTPAITYLIAQIALNYGISDAWAYSFTMEGHEFIRWTFPSDNGGNGSTYQFDTTTNLWSEVMTYPYSYSNPGRHIGNTYFYFNNKHYLTSYADGKIYEMSSSFYDDFGNAITSTRIAPPLDDKTMLNNTFISKVQVDADLPGVFLVSISNATNVSISSHDGINWSQVSFGTGQAWSGISWNGFVFCAICGGVGTATSPDGVHWILHTSVMPWSGSWSAIAWNGFVFCAIMQNSAVSATSPDGVSWTLGTMPSSSWWGSLAWNGTVFCAVCNSSANFTATSTDGLSWTLHSAVLPISGAWSHIIWNGTVFCTVCTGSSYSATSPDGVTWTTGSMPVNSGWSTLAWNGTVFCAISTNLYLGSYISATSTDGLTWSSLVVLPHGSSIAPIVWNGTVFCVVLYSTAYALTSPDGITWSTQSLPSLGYWTAIASNSFNTTGNILLSWSKDGGQTYSTPMTSIGNMNIKNSRLVWYRLGVGRQWQFNLTDTRVSKKVLLNAYLDVQGGTS